MAQIPDVIPNENLKKTLIDAYVYRDLKENVVNLTFQLEKLLKNNIININDHRFSVLYKNKCNLYEFYNNLNINELQYLGF